jgi:hypothetical protein
MANVHDEQELDSYWPDAVDRNVHPSHAESSQSGGGFFEICVKVISLTNGQTGWKVWR